MITLKFDKLYNRDRVAQPCFASIPLASGTLRDADMVTMWQKEEQLPLQTKVLSRYPNGSVRYLLVRFLADIPANKTTTVELDLYGERRAQEVRADAKQIGVNVCGNELGRMVAGKQTVLVTALEQGFRVDTGTMEFTVANGGTSLFERVCALGKEYSKGQFAGMQMEMSDKKTCGMTYGDWKIVEEGPVCVILSNQGKLAPGLLCETRVAAYAGKNYAEVEYRLVNATGEAASMASWEFKVDMRPKEGPEVNSKDKSVKVRTCVADSNYKTNFLIGEAGEMVEKTITAEFLMNQGNEHFAEIFHGTFFADYTAEDGGVCATIYQAHQNFPKAVLADKNGLVLKLVPEGSEPAVLQPGMALKQSFQLLFHSPEEDLQEINHQSTMYQMPDRPMVPVEVYEESGLYPQIFVKQEKRNRDVECALIMSADIHTRSYGMLHWGDAPDPGYTAQGRGKGSLVWTNNEYDYPHACMLQLARTGLRRYFDYCIVAGTHQRDVDICHYSENPLLQGGQWEHTHGHCLEGVIVCSHQWVEGILDCYHLTGDERFYEAAIGIGENVLRLLDTPEYQKTGGMSARETGWALRTLVALYKETFEERWLTKCDWIVEQFKEWGNTYGGWLAPYTDNTVIRVPFMISVAVGSLMRYYREFPRNDVKEMLVQAVEDMTENCMTEWGYFYYKELPSLGRIGNNTLILEALAIAYELTGDKKFLECGKRTFDTVVQNSLSMGLGSGKHIVETAVLSGTTGTKRFAQMLVPMLTYYKAVAECDML